MKKFQYFAVIGLMFNSTLCSSNLDSYWKDAIASTRYDENPVIRAASDAIECGIHEKKEKKDVKQQVGLLEQEATLDMLVQQYKKPERQKSAKEISPKKENNELLSLVASLAHQKIGHKGQHNLGLDDA